MGYRFHCNQERNHIYTYEWINKWKETFHSLWYTSHCALHIKLISLCFLFISHFASFLCFNLRILNGLETWCYTMYLKKKTVWSWNIPWLGWWYESVLFLILQIMTLLFAGYSAILALEVMKRQIQLPSLLWICLVSRLVYPIPILNILSNIYFAIGKMIVVVWWRTCFIPSNRSWEIGSPTTGGAGRMKLSCVVPASVILTWLIQTSRKRIPHLSVSTASVFWQFATF